MDNFVNEKDYKILEGDKFTFLVLRRIIDEECKVLLSDHEKLIICYSNPPFPIWVWSADNLTNKEKEDVYKKVIALFPLNENYSFMMKYDLAEYFINRAKEDETSLSITLNMFAYECINPIEPEYVSDGTLYKCKEQDIDEVVELMDLFHKDINTDIESLEEYKKQANKGIKEGKYYFWKNNEGKTTACCSLNSRADTLAIGLVYTRNEYRRKHYAQNLVYQVSKIAKDMGFNPTLYTNADYSASNACYQKIGYQLRGKLCRIGKN